MMRRIIFLKTTLAYTFFTLMLFSCSSDSDDSVTQQPEEEIELTFDITTTLSDFSYGVDETISFAISSESVFKEVCINVANFSPEVVNIENCETSIDEDGIGKSITASLGFVTPGSRDITVSAKDFFDNTQSLDYTIDIGLTNTVQITKVTINAFDNMGESYDPEFDDTDVNRLADLVFLLKKRAIGAQLRTSTLADADWYTSEVIQNESAMTWDLEDENLIVGAEALFTFYLYDDDGEFEPQSLLMGPPDFVKFSFAEFTNEKPNQITLSNTDIGLEVVFDVIWN